MYSPKLSEGEAALIMDMVQKELDEVKCEIIDQENECYKLLNKILAVCDVENAKKNIISKSYDGKFFEIGKEKTYSKGVKYLEVIEDLKNKKKIITYVLFNPDGSIDTIRNMMSQKGRAPVLHRDSGPALIVKRGNETSAVYAQDNFIGREGKPSFVKIVDDYKVLKYFSKYYRSAKIIIDKVLRCEFPGKSEFDIFLVSHSILKGFDMISCTKEIQKLGQNCLNNCNEKFERIEV